MSGRDGTMSLATSRDIMRSGAGGVRCHSTEGKRAEVAGAEAEAEDGRESEAEGVPLTEMCPPVTSKTTGSEVFTVPHKI